jgi:hypothetical protein
VTDNRCLLDLLVDSESSIFFRNVGKCIGLEVLTAMVMNSYAFWDLKQCIPFKVNGLFGKNISPPSSVLKSKPSKMKQLFL